MRHLAAAPDKTCTRVLNCCRAATPPHTAGALLHPWCTNTPPCAVPPVCVSLRPPSFCTPPAHTYLHDDAGVAALLQVALALLQQLPYQQHDGTGAVPAHHSTAQGATQQGSKLQSPAATHSIATAAAGCCIWPMDAPSWDSRTGVILPACCTQRRRTLSRRPARLLCVQSSLPWGSGSASPSAARCRPL